MVEKRITLSFPGGGMWTTVPGGGNRGTDLETAVLYSSHRYGILACC
ncbi:hypothetical protein VULLAG_LOCUS10388 [Vulpes lagopus]